MLNGVTQLIMTKADILSGFEKIKVCTAYKTAKEVIYDFPYELYDVVEPVYEELPVWTEELTGVRAPEDLPKQLKDYIRYIEKHVGVPVTIVSVGPNRQQTIVLR